MRPSPVGTSYHKIVFLESIDGVESLFTRGLRQGAAESGAEVDVIFLRDSKGKTIPASELVAQICSHQPDLICFIMDAPLHYPFLWSEPELTRLPKFSFWFDDFTRSPHTLKKPYIWQQWQQKFNVAAFIWDDYWRQKWREIMQCEAFPVHLAADEKLYDAEAEPAFPELAKSYVLLGTIPSEKSLHSEQQALPTAINKVLRETIQHLHHADWPVTPYESFQSITSQNSQKLQTVCEAWLLQPENQAILNHLLWRWGKRITRLRGLQAVARQAPVAVLSGHHREPFATEDEIRSHLAPDATFTFHDTTRASQTQWSRFFRSGKAQLQFTDPQSRSGGIPFRVFECAACGVPLLTDTRAELAQLFPSDNTSIYQFQDEVSLARFTSLPNHELKSLTEATLQLFLQKHTWTQRWLDILNTFNTSLHHNLNTSSTSISNL